jgi:hypothetical protein
MSGIVGKNLGRGSGVVAATPVGADAVSGSNVADDAIGAEHLADNAVGLAALAGGTDGQIISWDASGDPVALGPGTDGQVLTSTGAGSPPAFEAAAGGGAWEYLSTSTFSGVSSVDITSADSISQANHNVIACYFECVYPTDVTTRTIHMRYSEDNGSSFSSASDYNYAAVALDDAGTAHSFNGGAQSSIQLSATTHSPSTPYGLWGWLHFPLTSQVLEGVGTTWHFQGREPTSNDFWVVIGAGNERASGGGDWDAFQFFASSGNITGKIHVYGIKSS